MLRRALVLATLVSPGLARGDDGLVSAEVRVIGDSRGRPASAPPARSSDVAARRMGTSTASLSGMLLTSCRGADPDTEAAGRDQDRAVLAILRRTLAGRTKPGA